MKARGFVVALLGAESTGKTTLARGLGEVFRGRGLRVAVVDEFLREFCARELRTPRPDEQVDIAREQTRRIGLAARSCDLVLADTTALMTAVYSEWVFGDKHLYADAQERQRSYGLTLLTGLDVAWQADGLQRDGAHVRKPIDASIRAALARAGCRYAVVLGRGSARLEAAVAAVDRALTEPGPETTAGWRWHCERCGDPACERHLLEPSNPGRARLTGSSSSHPAG